jgi:uncharacterized protein YcbK (DUF882 family)
MIWLLPIVLILFFHFNEKSNGFAEDMQLTKNFNLSEFTKHGNNLPLDLLPNMKELVNNLQVLRDYLQEPILINSGYRSPEYNKKVGGVKNSYHTKGMASDIRVVSLTPKELHTVIEKLISEKKMKQGGLGLYGTFVHYDVRGSKARWNG